MWTISELKAGTTFSSLKNNVTQTINWCNICRSALCLHGCALSSAERNDSTRASCHCVSNMLWWTLIIRLTIWLCFICHQDMQMRVWAQMHKRQRYGECYHLGQVLVTYLRQNSFTIKNWINNNKKRIITFFNMSSQPCLSIQCQWLYNIVIE